MPLYEYKCDKCGKVIEVRQRFSDEPLKVHDDCGGNLERLISMSAFQLKGTGWYATDYAKSSGGHAKNESGKSESAKSESPGDSSSASADKKSDTKTDSKPAETHQATADKSKSD